MFTCLTPTPLGEMLLLADADALLGAWFTGQKYYPADCNAWERKPSHPVLRAAAAQLLEYFSGKRRVFDLPLAPAGTTFQCTVWKALTDIPYGATCSYSEVAARSGAAAARPVGAAVGKNPVSVIIPCHRVLGKDGSLTGYAGGLERKAKLLALETR